MTPGPLAGDTRTPRRDAPPSVRAHPIGRRRPSRKAEDFRWPVVTGPPAPHLPKGMSRTHPNPPAVARPGRRRRPAPQDQGCGPRVGPNHTAELRTTPEGRDRFGRRGLGERQPRPAGPTGQLPQADLPGFDRGRLPRLAGRPGHRPRPSCRQDPGAAEPVSAGLGTGRGRQHPSPETARGVDVSPGSGRADSRSRPAIPLRHGRPWSPARLIAAVPVTRTVRGADGWSAPTTPSRLDCLTGQDPASSGLVTVGTVSMSRAAG